MAVSAKSPQLVQRRQARLQDVARMRSLHDIHAHIARQLLLDEPSTVTALQDARKMVDLWERDGVCSRFYVDSWKKILSGTPQQVGRALANIDAKWKWALLQNTPFGSLVRKQP